MRVKCPHGVEAWMGADDLGYFTVPKGCEHPEPRPVTVTQSAGWWKTRKALRRAKRQLKDL